MHEHEHGNDNNVDVTHDDDDDENNGDGVDSKTARLSRRCSSQYLLNICQHR